VSTEIREGSLARTDRRWRPWIPWTVVLAGGAVAVTGMGIALNAKSNYDDFQSCQTSPGMCGLSPQEIVDRMNHESHVARLATIPSLLGGAAVATGVVLLLVVPTNGGGAAAVGWTF
jgi:hypothetical protein